MKVWETFTNQQQWKEYLQNLVRTNDKALMRAIWVIYCRQTDSERVRGETTEHNGQGFGKVDAEFFTSLVHRVQAGQGVASRDLAIARNKMPKYWRQLMEISKERMATEAEAAHEKSPSE